MIFNLYAYICSTMKDYTINVRGQLLSLSRPQVMGIMNVTPDSFYAPSRVQTADAMRRRVKQMEEEGATLIDIGACSTNPYLEHFTSEEEETARLEEALEVVKETQPRMAVSIDTFRPKVARMCIEKYGVDMINDVSTGGDPEMFRVVAETGTPYILMSQKANLHDMLIELAQKVQELRDLGQKDIILDPGYGFGKSMEENFRLYDEIDRFGVLGLPLLVGISRKRMVYQTLCITPDDSLNGTTVLNTIALMKGASILRVHDVKAAVQAVRLYEKVVCSNRTS